MDGVGAGYVEPEVVEVILHADSVHVLEAYVAELAHATVGVILAVWVHLHASSGRGEVVTGHAGHATAV